jgi:hypothetical protein
MHFNAGVMLPARITKTSTARQIRRAIEMLLFRFSEEFELEPYIEECDCIVESRSFFKKRNKRYGKADPSCETCNGTGKMKTTDNQFACFDWWEIGGNWDGDLKGMKRKSNVVWRNCLRVRDLPSDYGFFALVTPNKQWHEQWQFMEGKRSEKKEKALWHEFQQKLRKQHSERLLVLIDCHR